MLNIGVGIRMNILILDTRNVEQTKDVRMYIEEFILVEIWIHCCTKLNWMMNGKNAILYTLATEDWEMWELLLEVNWQMRVNRITIAWEPVNYEN